MWLTDGQSVTIEQKLFKIISNLKKLNIFENIQSRIDQIRNSIITKDFKKIRNEFHSKIFSFRFENFEFRTPLLVMCISENEVLPTL
jgi:hypothetical protein